MSLPSRVSRLGGGAGSIWSVGRGNKNSASEAEPIELRQRETPDSRPETFFDAEFLRKLERLHLVAKRLGRGEGRARRFAQGLQPGILGLPPLSARRRSALRGLEYLPAPRAAVVESFHRRGGNEYLSAGRYQPLHGRGRAGETRVRQKSRRGAGLHRAEKSRPGGRRGVFVAPGGAAHARPRPQAGAEPVSLSRRAFLRRGNQPARGDPFVHQSFSPSRLRRRGERSLRSGGLARRVGRALRQAPSGAG